MIGRRCPGRSGRRALRMVVSAFALAAWLLSSVALELGPEPGLARGATALAATPHPCPPTPTLNPVSKGAVPAPAGEVENALGTLIVRRATGQVEEVRGKASVPLYEGDECRTEKGSKALIRLTDGTMLAMNDGTTLALRARTAPEGAVVRVLKLILGELWMKTVGAPAIEVETPAAVAAIKGTEFDLRVDEDGKSVLTVLKGVVVLKNEFCSPCTVDAASQSVVARGQRCEQAVPVDPTPAIAWLAGVAP